MTSTPAAAPPPALARLASYRVAVPLLVALAALPRLLDASRTPLIYDEIYAVLLARMGLVEALAVLGRDVDQPLIFVVTWAWRALGGEHGPWLKLPAIAVSLGLVAATALVGRSLFGPAAGLLAAALLAFHPTHILYSQQARFIPFSWFFLTVVVGLAWRWVERPRRLEAAGLVVAAALALYTEWFTSIVLATVAVWGATRLRRDPARRRAWLGLFALALLLNAPQLGTLGRQMVRDIAGEWLLPPMPLEDLFVMVRKLAFSARYMVPALIVAAVLPLVRPATRRPAALLLLVAGVGIAAPWLLSQAGIHLFIYRQMLFMLPLVCVLVAASLVSIPRPALRLAACALAVAFAARACLLRQPVAETVDLSGALAEIRAQSRPGALVVSCETRALLFVMYHYPEADARLLEMPGAEKFHYSDGILVIPPERRIRPAELAARARREPWWGIRLPHAGRDGPLAAAFLTQATGGRVRRFGRVTAWEGGAPPPLVGAAPAPDGPEPPAR